MASFRKGLKRVFNAFMGRDAPTVVYRDYGQPSYMRPDKRYSFITNQKSIITTIYNRIAMDVASVKIRHAKTNQDGNFESEMDSYLNQVLSLDANIDETGRAMIQNAVQSMFDEGAIAIVPVETDVNPETQSYDIYNLRVGRIITWYPQHVKVKLYDERTGKYEEIVVSKQSTAIIQNPMYEIMNEPNSTIQRLIKKFSYLDILDERSTSEKLDLIIQLPYVVKSETKKKEAEERRKDVEMQLSGSKYGVAYIDGTEKVIQLNRSIQNNLLSQIEYLTKQAFTQLGVTDEILNGTAPDTAMLNYYNRIIEPVLSAICDEMTRKFLTSTARTQHQKILYLNNPFKLVTAEKIASMADTLTRNEIASSNEIRALLGWKPSSDPKADELLNSNLNHPDEGTSEEDYYDEEAPGADELDLLVQELANRRNQ